MGITVREKVKGSGEWWIFAHHNKLRRSKKIGDRKVAEKVAQALEAKFVLNDLGFFQEEDASLPVFSSLAEDWLETYIKPPLRAKGTYNVYLSTLKIHINPVFGEKQIDKITTGDIKKTLSWLLVNGHSKSTISRCIACLSGAFTMAMDLELVDRDPTIGVAKMLQVTKGRKKKVEPFTGEEIDNVLLWLKKRKPDCYPLFLTLHQTGMRIGEVCALRWSDVNWKNKTIHLQRAATQQDVHDLKSGRSRVVDMSDDLILVLSAYQHASKVVSLDGTGYIFTAKGGKRLHAQTSLRLWFSQALKGCGINHRRIHDLRHTYASTLLSNGVDILYVKEQLGHASITETVDTYSQYIKAKNSRSAVNVLNSGKQGADRVHSGCGKRAP